VARGIAVWTLGDSATIVDPHTESGTYAGRIIGETKYHMIQRLSPQSAVAHPKHLLDMRLVSDAPRVGQVVRIHYSNEQGSVRECRLKQRERGLGR
jgi:hypothetical protein